MKANISATVLAIILLLSWVSISTQCAAKVASSIDRVINALNEFNQLAQNLTDLLNKHELNSAIVKELMNDFKRISGVVKITGNKTFAANPLNAFFFVKLLSYDMDTMARPTYLRLRNVSQKVLETLPKEISALAEKFHHELPSKQDVSNIIDGLIRILDYYQYDIESFAQGKFSDNKHLKPYKPINYSDCYLIAIHAFNKPMLHQAYLWANYSLKLYDRSHPELKPSTTPPEFKISIYKLLTKIAYQEGNKMAVIDYLSMLNALDWSPEMYNWTNNIFEKLSKIGEPIDFAQNPELSSDRPNYLINPRQIAFEHLCREEQKLRKFSCRYRRDRPHLIIGPLKEETISENPLILAHYDIISVSKTKQLRRTAVEHLEKTVSADNNLSYESLKIRELDENFLKGLKMTFDVDATNRTWTALSFGPTGYLWPSEDISVYDDSRTNSRGLYQLYTDEIEIAGDVAFPDLNIKFKPQSRSSLLIYNLERKPLQIAHCPIVVGMKWTFNMAF